MTTTFDIYRSARLLIDKHGDEAPIHAAMQADELLEAGDMDGVAAWKRILRAAGDLPAKERPGGEAETDLFYTVAINSLRLAEKRKGEKEFHRANINAVTVARLLAGRILDEQQV